MGPLMQPNYHMFVRFSHVYGCFWILFTGPLLSHELSSVTDKRNPAPFYSLGIALIFVSTLNIEIL